MGRLFDNFGELRFNNEAEVSQNFIQPLLQDFLGYNQNEILPEAIYPAGKIYSGVNFNKKGSKGLIHRPDFVVCLNGDPDQPKFIIDSKGPNEKVDSHLGQLRSYALSVGINFLMMTNGSELQVYDVNLLLFRSNDINELQINIDSLLSIVSRENQSTKRPIDILREFKPNEATISSGNDILDNEIRKRKVLLADFQPYLEKISNDYLEWHTPTLHFQALNNLELSKIDPNLLLRFQLHDINDERKQKQFSLHSIEHDKNIKIKILIGDTGTGKSCLLKYLSHQSSSRGKTFREVRIPVFVQLREIGHQYNLEDLIVASLNRNGYPCKSFFDLPKKNDFIFYLDAFDEIGENFLAEVSNAIENLATTFECYVTTRPNKIPKLKPSIIYETLPISDWQAKEIIQKHLGDRYYEFHRKLENTKLNTEAGNILLLLCLISVFKESGALPNTMTNVIGSIVKRVESWQNSKIQPNLLSWANIEYFLSSIAHQIIESEQTSISRIEVESLILDSIFRLEQLRKMDTGQSVDKVLEALRATGLLLCNSDSIYFWHRLFLNHFAAIALKLNHNLEENTAKVLVKKKYWHIPILHVASMIEDVTPLISGWRNDIWFAAECLSQNSKCEITVLKEIVEELLKISTSEIPELRIRASHFLVKIECDYVLNALYQAIEADLGAEIKMFALSAVAKTKSDRARNLIFKHLKWDDNSFFGNRSSQTHICRALYYYGEAEHLLIIENWKEFKDYLMSLECGRIFTDLYNQGNLTPALINLLRIWFWDIVVSSENSVNNSEELVKILSLVPDDSFSLKVLDWHLKSKKHNLDSAIITLMMGTKSSEFMEELKNRLLNGNNQGSYIIFRLTDVACRSDITMPIDYYLDLIGSTNVNIASSAVAALGRFKFEVSKQIIETHLYGNQAQLQNAALKALMENGEVIDLVQKDRFPEYVFNPTIHSLLKAVRRYNLFDAAYILDGIFNHIEKNKIEFDEFNIAIDLAGTYHYIGEYEKYKVILSWYFDGNKLIQAKDFIHHHLIKNIKYFDTDMAMKIIIGYFNYYFPFDFDQSGGYEMEVFLEATEELGRYELVEYIKRIVGHLLVATSNSYNPKYHLERPMRALASLVQTRDEDWILGNLDSMKTNEGFQFPELRRSAECLAFCGTRKSLPYLQKIAKQFKHKEAIVDICQLAFEQVCLREGMTLDNDVLNFSG